MKRSEPSLESEDALSRNDSTSAIEYTRRSFLGKATVATLLAGVPAGLTAQQSAGIKGKATNGASKLVDLLRMPDSVIAYEKLTDALPLTRSNSEWHGTGIDVAIKMNAGELTIDVHAPGLPMRYMHVRWSEPVAADQHVLGDHWERSYGDLGWRTMVPDRVLPWYFATWDGNTCNSYGVKTGAGSLCFWQIDPAGVSLWLNLSNGGSGVKLGQRTLTAATVVTRKGVAGEEPNSALHTFCKQMCAHATRTVGPVYGTNDWYYAYGNNSARQILDDTEFIAGLSEGNAVRPFSVIDMGWADGSPKFPSMAELVRQIQQFKVRPGIWIRPLEAPAATDSSLVLPGQRFGELRDRARELAYDPTIPEALEKVIAKVKQVVGWGFELVKHDFSTYDLLGRWGFEMGAEPTTAGWSLHDPTRTNAEVILALYKSIREACNKDTLILGCNTIGHLGQGNFDMQRTGDDTSGRIWERTRRMGVNTLAFRLPQHGAFFVQDADCVGISAAVPWEVNRQWLDLLAHSGTALFISPGEGSRTPEHADAIRDAFKLAAAGGDGAHAASYLGESAPQTWNLGDRVSSAAPKQLHFDWYGQTGAYPFTV